MTTRWKRKREKKKENFHWTRMCLSLRDWVQLMLIGYNRWSTRIAFCVCCSVCYRFPSRWKALARTRPVSKGKSPQLAPRPPVNGSENCIKHQSPSPGPTKGQSQAPVLCEIRFDIKATAKQKCRRAFDVQILL